MIGISCKFYLQNNDVSYTYCINLAEAIIRHQKSLLTCRDFFGSYKTLEGSGLTPKYTEYQKVKS